MKEEILAALALLSELVEDLPLEKEMQARFALTTIAENLDMLKEE